jgi:hypothetical protein
MVRGLDAGPEIRQPPFGSRAHESIVVGRANDLLSNPLITRAADEAPVDQHLAVEHAFDDICCV